jgi:uncharacterized protein (DUF427 family)
MTKAVWNGKILAESENTEVVEGNHYFPEDSIKKEFFSKSDTKSVCPWKGEASYYNIEVDGKINANAAWYYPEPKPAASNIKNFIAFWKGVEITD